MCPGSWGKPLSPWRFTSECHADWCKVLLYKYYCYCYITTPQPRKNWGSVEQKLPDVIGLRHKQTKTWRISRCYNPLQASTCICRLRCISSTREKVCQHTTERVDWKHLKTPGRVQSHWCAYHNCEHVTCMHIATAYTRNEVYELKAYENTYVRTYAAFATYANGYYS